jgi:hypothetical protein
MPSAITRDPELVQLTELCREMAALGLSVGLSDAAPRATVRTSPARLLCITVDVSLKYFEWCEAEERHPATDPAGAAARVAEYIKTSDAGAGERP